MMMISVPATTASMYIARVDVFKVDCTDSTMFDAILVIGVFTVASSVCDMSAHLLVVMSPFTVVAKKNQSICLALSCPDVPLLLHH